MGPSATTAPELATLVSGHRLQRLLELVGADVAAVALRAVHASLIGIRAVGAILWDGVACRACLPDRDGGGGTAVVAQASYPDVPLREVGRNLTAAPVLVEVEAEGDQIESIAAAVVSRAGGSAEQRVPDPDRPLRADRAGLARATRVPGEGGVDDQDGLRSLGEDRAGTVRGVAVEGRVRDLTSSELVAPEKNRPPPVPPASF